MIQSILIGVGLLFAGCASSLVNRKEDGTLDTEASSTESKEKATQMACYKAANYCDEKKGYDLLREPIVNTEDYRVSEMNCGNHHDWIGFSFVRNDNPKFGLSHNLGNYEQRCPSVFRYVTEWTVKLNFRCKQ